MDKVTSINKVLESNIDILSYTLENFLKENHAKENFLENFNCFNNAEIETIKEALLLDNAIYKGPIYDIINYSFIWKDTNEGENFWSYLHDNWDDYFDNRYEPFILEVNTCWED